MNRQEENKSYSTAELIASEARLLSLIAIRHEPMSMKAMQEGAGLRSQKHLRIVLGRLLSKGLLYVDTPYSPLPAVDEEDSAGDEEEEDELELLAIPHPF